MLRVLVLQDDPSDIGFYHQAMVSSLLLPGGCQVKRAWAITESENWANVTPSLHYWLISAKQVLEFSPHVLIVEGDPGLKQLPETLVAQLQAAKAVFLYLRAHPFNRTETEGFQRVGFPLAQSQDEEIAYLATTPNDSTVRLQDVSFPGGLWTDSSGDLSFSQLEARGRSYILCPEEGGFLPLLTAPLYYDAKDPVWRYDNRFGAARKPYCFAGIRWRPARSILFACDMFSDRYLELGENRKLIRSIFTDILLNVAEQERPDRRSAMIGAWTASIGRSESTELR